MSDKNREFWISIIALAIIGSGFAFGGVTIGIIILIITVIIAGIMK